MIDHLNFMKKKIIVTALVLSMTLAATGCGGDKKEESTPSSAPVESVAPVSSDAPVESVAPAE